MALGPGKRNPCFSNAARTSSALCTDPLPLSRLRIVPSETPDFSAKVSRLQPSHARVAAIWWWVSIMGSRRQSFVAHRVERGAQTFLAIEVNDIAGTNLC